MSKISYSITPTAITVVVGNRPRVVSVSSMNYVKLADALRKPEHDVELIADLADIGRFVARVTLGEVQIADGEVRWRGEKVRNVIAERLIELLKAGSDLAPLSAFLGRVMLNPSKVAQDELFLWLESGSQPITPEGKILAFKKVRSDYLDIYTGTISNAVGQKPEMKREDVDPNRDRTCSHGLHFCSYGYLSQYGSGSSDVRIMIVEVDPADVVAIPKDYSNQKGRCWIYEVVGEVPYEDAREFFSNAPVVAPYRQPSDGLDINGVDEYEDEDADRDEYEDLYTGEAELETRHSVVFLVGDFVTYQGSQDDAWQNDVTIGKDYYVFDVCDEEIEIVDDQGDVSWVLSSDFIKKVEEAEAEAEAKVETADKEVPEQSPGKAELMFHHGERSFLAHELISLVGEHGQRGVQRLTGVPRTTIQTWLAAIKNQ